MKIEKAVDEAVEKAKDQFLELKGELETITSVFLGLSKKIRGRKYMKVFYDAGFEGRIDWILYEPSGDGIGWELQKMAEKLKKYEKALKGLASASSIKFHKEKLEESTW